jgi:hypothetical protein
MRGQRSKLRVKFIMFGSVVVHIRVVFGIDVMLNNISDLVLDKSINNILYGNLDYDVNWTLFAAVHRYIVDLSNVYTLLIRLPSTTQHQ